MNIAYGDDPTRKRGSINKGMDEVGNSEMKDIATPHPILNIHVSAKSLPKLDIGSQSDPMCVLFIPINGQYVEVARTEVIWDNPNPQWIKFFQAMYIFETQQPLRFSVYDCDSTDEKKPLSAHDFIGSVDTDVQRIVSSQGSELKLPLHNSKKPSLKAGELCITSEQCQSSSSSLDCKISVSGLKKMRTFAKNNPYLIIYKCSEAGVDIPVYRSKVQMKCYSTAFPQFLIPMQNITQSNDLDSPITLAIFDFVKNKVDNLIGKCSGSIRSFLETVGTGYTLFSDDKKRKSVGQLKFTQLQMVKKPTFLSYLRSGLQLNLITAIDFTASNKDPRDPSSLHFMQPNVPNQYETCISGVGSIICPYDSDQMFPVYGFGGKIDGQVSHCFPLTFNIGQPNVHGLEGILAIYRESLMRVQLSGPTLFAPVIRAATDVANASYSENKTYTILLICTDGIINDMNETIDAIVDASNSPLSIIIVGVGSANFDAMDILDADDVPLRSSNGVMMSRDIVQFVPFRKYQANNGFGLPAAVLAEVPSQVDDFCRKCNFPVILD